MSAILSALGSLSKEEAGLRLRVVEEATSWIGTPYHTNGDIKGAGVDCGMLLIRVYADTGVIEPFDPRPYPAQWSFNQRTELYLQSILRFATEVESPLPADVAVFKVGHCWGHGAIITSWPDIIHANPPSFCREDNCRMNLSLRKRTPRFFSRWAR